MSHHPNIAVIYGLEEAASRQASSTEGGAFRADRPRIWADGRFTEFDLHPGGERIAVLQVPDALSPAGSGRAIVIFNFFEELRRLAPPSPR